MTTSTIGIIGTGSVGSALGNLLSTSGADVVWGARDVEKAAARLGPEAVVMSIADVLRDCRVLIVAVPWTEALPMLRGLPPLEGHIVVDATNPLQADWSPLVLGSETSAGEEIQRALQGARVVKAFNTIFADMMRPEALQAATSPVTAFLCGDDADAKAFIAGLAQRAGFAPVDVGPLLCARYLEAMAHLNIQIAVGMKGGTHAHFSYAQQ